MWLEAWKVSLRVEQGKGGCSTWEGMAHVWHGCGKQLTEFWELKMLSGYQSTNVREFGDEAADIK